MRSDGGYNFQDEAWTTSGEIPLLKPMTHAARQASDGFNKTAQVVDKEVTDPTNYLPFGVFAKAGGKASKLVKVGKLSDKIPKKFKKNWWW